MAVLNRQKQIDLDLTSLRKFVREVRNALKMGRGDFNVCFVNDEEIRRLNLLYRDKPAPTDVLSFPWQEEEESGLGEPDSSEFSDFWGDVVISVETASRNALIEGHSSEAEIRWLILHGALHLLGYDHEKDHGEMTALELSLRERLARTAGASSGRSATTSRRAG